MREARGAAGVDAAAGEAAVGERQQRLGAAGGGGAPQQADDVEAAVVVAGDAWMLLLLLLLLCACTRVHIAATAAITVAVVAPELRRRADGCEVKCAARGGRDRPARLRRGRRRRRCRVRACPAACGSAFQARGRGVGGVGGGAQRLELARQRAQLGDCGRQVAARRAAKTEHRLGVRQLRLVLVVRPLAWDGGAACWLEGRFVMGGRRSGVSTQGSRRKAQRSVQRSGATAALRARRKKTPHRTTRHQVRPTAAPDVTMMTDTINTTHLPPSSRRKAAAPAL